MYTMIKHGFITVFACVQSFNTYVEWEIMFMLTKDKDISYPKFVSNIKFFKSCIRKN